MVGDNHTEEDEDDLMSRSGNKKRPKSNKKWKKRH